MSSNIPQLIDPRIAIIANLVYGASCVSLVLFFGLQRDAPIPEPPKIEDKSNELYAVNSPPIVMREKPPTSRPEPKTELVSSAELPPVETTQQSVQPTQTNPVRQSSPPPMWEPDKTEVRASSVREQPTPEPVDRPVELPVVSAQASSIPEPPFPIPETRQRDRDNMDDFHAVSLGFSQKGRPMPQYKFATVDEYIKAAGLLGGVFLAYDGSTAIKIGRTLDPRQAKFTHLTASQLSVYAKRFARLTDLDPRVTEMLQLVRTEFSNLGSDLRIDLALPPANDSIIYQAQSNWFEQHGMEMSDQCITHGQLKSTAFGTQFLIDRVTDLQDRELILESVGRNSREAVSSH